MEPLTYGQHTDVGRVRKVNQDSVAVLGSADLLGLADGLFVVADGMGGRAGGEIASRVTVETVPKVVKEILGGEDGNSGRLREAVHDALITANEAVFGQAKANPELRGMGTTCVAVLVSGETAVIGNIGDSRVYLLRDGAFQALTHDHSLVAQHVESGELSVDEARSSRYRNIITRAIGIAEAVEPDVETLRLEPGDTILLCTDGLTNMLTDAEIARILARGDSPATTCEYLAASANAAGGSDNITVVVLRYGSFVPVEIPPEEFGSEPEAHPNRYVYPKTARPSYWRYAQIPLLFTVVAVCWFILARYELHLDPPYLRPRRSEFAPEKVIQREPKKPDLVNLDFDSKPEVLNVEDIRPGMLELTPDGKPVTVTRDGKIRPSERYGLAALRQDGRLLESDSVGNLYIFNPTEQVITKHDARTGKRIGSLGRGHLRNPTAVAVGANGDVFVLDSGRILRFRAKPRPATVEKPDGPG